MTLKTPQDQQAVNARPTPQWDFAPEGALASSPQVGLGGAGGRALLSSILNTYVQKKHTGIAVHNAATQQQRRSVWICDL